jgi:hypothetical protein
MCNDIENSQLDSRDHVSPSLEIPEHICNHDGLMGCCDICGGYDDRD